MIDSKQAGRTPGKTQSDPVADTNGAAAAATNEKRAAILAAIDERYRPTEGKIEEFVPAGSFRKPGRFLFSVFS